MYIVRNKKKRSITSNTGDRVSERINTFFTASSNVLTS